MSKFRYNSYGLIIILLLLVISGFSFVYTKYLVPEKDEPKAKLLGNPINSYVVRVHTDKSLKWLKKRIHFRKFLNLASTFYDVESAHEIIKDIIDENQARINKWVQDPAVLKNTRKSFRKKYNYPIGYGVDKNLKYHENLYDVKVVLQKVNNLHYKLVTAYPIPRER